MKNTVKLLVVSLVMASSGAFASGFICKGDGYTIKLFNHTDATRTPAALIVSSVSEGTLFKAFEDEIHKYNGSDHVSYMAGVDDEVPYEGIHWVSLQIDFKEGKDVLKAGEEVDGSATLTSNDDSVNLNLTCERYLKNQ
jgi:hypothetical protein